MTLWVAYDCTGYVFFLSDTAPVRLINEENQFLDKLWTASESRTSQYRTNTTSPSSHYLSLFIEKILGRSMEWEDEPIRLDIAIIDKKFMSIEEKIKNPHDRDLFVAGMAYALDKEWDEL